MFAEKLAKLPVEEAIRKYVYLNVVQMTTMWETAKSIGDFQLQGTGVELGAGCGLLSSVVAKVEDVEKIYAVEICEEITATLLPRVSEAVLGANNSKVIPVVGSFDDMRLEDQSIDFIVEIDSLHHSHDLGTTLRECSRIIKPGGYLICFDRCHPNYVTDDQVKKMLDKVYSKEFLLANGYPSDKPLTRRQNGEHEYRKYEWQDAFATAGFELLETQRVRKKLDISIAMKGLISLLPAFLRNKMIKDNSETFSTFLHWLSRKMGSYKNSLGRSYVGPKNSTVFVLKKQRTLG